MNVEKFWGKGYVEAARRWVRDCKAEDPFRERIKIALASTRGSRQDDGLDVDANYWLDGYEDAWREAARYYHACREEGRL